MASTTSLDLSKKLIKSTNRKPSIPVRQTKTSKIRTELGNKLEYLKNNLQKLKESMIDTSRSDIASSAGSDKCNTFKKPMNVGVMNRKSVVSRSTEITSRTNSGLKPTQTFKKTSNSPSSNNKNIPIKTAQSESKLKKQNEQSNKMKRNLNKTNTQSFVLKNKTFTAKSKPTNNASSNNKTINIPKIEVTTIKPSLKKPTQEITLKNEKKTVKIQSPLRKSISAMHLKRVSIRDPNTAIFRSFSAVTFSETIDENETLELPCFNTPMAKRRSVYNSTPMTIPRNKHLSPWSGCWSPTAQDLKRRLSVWMEKNGKPYNSFNHLRCFGLHYLPAEEENKENVEVEQTKDSSYEDLHIIPTEADQTKEDVSVALKALQDLHKLILEGYPVDQCDAWLDVIRTRFEKIEDEQQYWECVAAVEKARENESYKQDENDLNLDNLLQKFNVLNLTPSSCTQKKRNRNMNESNIFQSTKINFSVRETSKNEDIKFLVTPVKRSTRQSTAGKLTPGVILCSTLDELDPSVRTSMHFKINKALKK